MTVLTIPVLAFGPALFWLWYFYNKDKLHPEPLKRIWSCFAFGMAVGIPAAAINDIVKSVSPVLFMLMSAPIAEESLKFWAFRQTAPSEPERSNPVDALIYAVSVALGFAAIENVTYLVTCFSQDYQIFTTVVVLRAALSVPAHALFACIWGFRPKSTDGTTPEEAKRAVGRRLVLAMGMHSMFNLAAISGPFWIFGMVVVVPLLWHMERRRFREAMAVC
jgi:RsiW-degrading membrane proteinase PrsW (M82 family)